MLSQEITIILIASAFFLVVAIGIIILVLIYQKKQLAYTFEKEQLQSQYKNELLKTRLEAQEETMTWIAKELHDNLGQLLNSSKVLIGVAQRTGDTQDTLFTASETIAKSINEVRMLSKSLNREWLEQFSFVENVKAEAQRINSTREIVMTLKYPDEIQMAPEHQLVLFRMVQEAIQNSLKHGLASHIEVSTEIEASQLEVKVSDNGKGFDLENGGIKGFGMNSIQHRANLLGGSASWKSGERGTVLTILLPMN